jgi:hypothetical protein
MNLQSIIGNAIKKLPVIPTAIVLVFLIIVVKSMVTSSCLIKSTGNNLSPDNVYYVHAEGMDCGYTSAYTSSVIISHEKSKKAVLSYMGGITSVKTSWVDGKTLKITYTGSCPDIYHEESAWKDVKIIYDKQCSNTD